MTRPFFLPLIAPPRKDSGDPAEYYKEVKGVLTADSAGDALELALTNSDQLHPPAQAESPLPLWTVFAPTAGFVRYYPSADPLPTPDQQPIGLPADLITPQEIGSLVIKVWITEFRYLMRLRSAATPRPNRVVLGRLEKTSIEDAFRAEVAKLKREALLKAWEDGGGSGSHPDDAALKAAFLQRLMAGTAEIFVSAGTPLGRASLIADPDGVASQVAHMKLQAFFAPTDPNELSVAVPAEDLVDSVLEDSGRAALFTGHPLLEAINGPMTVTFESLFLIRDGVLRTYVPFSSRKVTLKRETDDGTDETVGDTTTDAAGKINWPDIGLLKRDVIWFELATADETVANRSYESDLRTNSHKAGWYLDADDVNTNLYRAGYQVHPEYTVFVEQLQKNEENEKFEDDRGNADSRKLPAIVVGDIMQSTQASMLQRIRLAEKNLNSDVPSHPANTFTMLVEGDSWLNYPPADGDIFQHLYDLMQAGLKKGITLNVFPMQHSGDRADQMFRFGNATGRRQWDFTHDVLSEYTIDLILCSAGGNDFAEPGISVNDRERYEGGFVEVPDQRDYYDYLDPYKSFVPNASTPAAAVTSRQMNGSFASLLKTHRWHSAIEGKTEAEHKQLASVLLLEVAQRFSALGVDLGTSTLKDQPAQLQDIGDKVIQEIDERQGLPDPAIDDVDHLLASIFNVTRYKTRFNSVKNDLQQMLNVASALRIPVLMHSYCYPLYNESPTTLMGKPGGKAVITGPWFTTRFVQAGIVDRRVQKICLKSLLDHFVMHILQPFKDQYKEVDVEGNDDFRFDYADVREVCMDASLWRDEMHLRGQGYIRVARKLYEKIAARFPQFFTA